MNFIRRHHWIGAILALCLPHMAGAQDNTVLLRSLDGSLSVQGTYFGIKDGDHVLEHPQYGLLRIAVDTGVSCVGAACSGPVEPMMAVVGDTSVTLSSLDGEMKLTGNLVDFDGENYTLQSPSVGRIMIKASPEIECLGAACPEIAAGPVERVIAGPAYEMAQLMPALLEGFASHIGAKLRRDGDSVVELTSADGIDLARFELEVNEAAELTDTAQMVITDRRLEAPLFTEHRIAHDGIILVTNPATGLRTLSLDALANILSGQTTDWSQYGKSTPISLHHAGQVSPNAVLSALGLAVTSEVGVTPHASSADLIEGLTMATGGLGLVRHSALASSDLQTLNVRNACGLLAAPTPFNLQNGAYPLAMDVFAYVSPAQADGILQDFAVWIGTAEGQDIVRGQGYVNDVPSEMQLVNMGSSLLYSAAMDSSFNRLLLPKLSEDLGDAERLSTAFRFELVSVVLDKLSVAVVEKFAQQVSGFYADGKEVLLVGFTDTSGDPVNNTRLAKSRAETVKAALLAQLPNATEDQITTLSYGELLPMSCNTSAKGRDLNRRVEVWIRPRNLN